MNNELNKLQVVRNTLSQQYEARMDLLNQMHDPAIEKILYEIERDVREVEKILQSFEYLKSRDWLDESYEENVLGIELMTDEQFVLSKKYLYKSMRQILEKYPNVVFNTTMMTIELRIDTPNNDTVFGSIFLTKRSINVHLWIAYDNGSNGDDFTKYFDDKNIKNMSDEILSSIISLIK